MALDDFVEEADTGLDLADVIAGMGRLGKPIPTTIPFLDRFLRRGGIFPGKLICVAGPPGSHKTTLATMLLNKLSPFMPSRGLFVDEGREEAAVRLGQQLGYQQDDLEGGAPGLLRFIKERMQGTFMLDDPDDRLASVRHSAALLKTQRNGHTSGLLVVDSVQTARLSAEQELVPEERLAIHALAYGFRNLCRTESLIGVLTAQANREQYKNKKESDRGNPLAASASSRAPEYASDLCIFMGLPDDDGAQTCYITKNRMGLKGKFYLKLDRVLATLIEIDGSEVEDAEEREKDDTTKKRIARVAVEVLDELAKNPGSTANQICANMAARRTDVFAALKNLEKAEKVSAQVVGKKRVYDLLLG